MANEQNVNNPQKVLSSFLATFGDPSDANAVANVQPFVDRIFTRHTHRAPDSNLALAAGTTPSINVASLHTVIAATDVPLKVKNFKLTTQANITATNTNLATFNLVYNNGNGGADTVIASADTSNTATGMGAVTSSIPISITMNASNVRIPAGSCVQIKVTKSGAGGLQLPELDMEVGLTPWL